MGTSRGTRCGALAVAVAVTVAIALLLVPGRTRAKATFELTRISGLDRFGTASAIAINTFTTGADVAVVTRGDTFPDALAGNYLAGFYAGPVLLSASDRVPDTTSQALASLRVKRVVLLGGTEALSDSVRAQLEVRGYEVSRVSGANRFASAAAIAGLPGAERVGTLADRGRTAIVATGLEFPDALTAGPISYKARFPTLLAATDLTLPQETATALRTLAVEHVIVVGGPSAVPPTVEGELLSMGISSQRMAGLDRYETSRAMADFAVNQLGFSTTHVNVGSGAAFSDALAGGPHAGQLGVGSVNLLTDRVAASRPTCEFLQGLTASLEDGHVYGGSSAVSSEARTELERCGGASAG